MTWVRETPKPQFTAPTSCPFCRSVNVKTTSKIIDESTYWRCIGCGVIWNPGRLGRRAPSLFGRRD